MLDRGIFDLDEARAYLGMAPLESGAGKLRLVPLNMQTVEAAAAVAQPAAAVATPSVDPVPQAARSIESRAAPDAVDVGDFVSWGSGDGRGRGRITRVVRDGEINVPDSSFTITGTADDPAALIRVYRESADGWNPTDVLVGHKFSTLTKIEPLQAGD